MALFKILRGPSSGLDKLTINDGWCYYTPDTGLFHIDYNGTRVPLNAKDAQTLSGASLVQALNREGLDKEILSAAVVKGIKENLELLISAKQEHITGTEGQVVVIGSNGSPTAVNASLSTSGGIIDQNTGEIIKMWHGTVEEYDAIAEKDDNTIYILTDEVGGDIVANDIEYDNSVSGLLSTSVQNAIDELATSSIQPDWNQNDETASDYIKNRTHWIDAAGEIHYIDPKYIKDMYYEVPVIIEEKTGTGITTLDSGWVKIADTLDFNINDVETFSCRTNKGQICDNQEVRLIEEEGQTILTDSTTEDMFAIYVTPEQAEINEYYDAGFYVWGSDEAGEEIEATYSFTLKSTVYKVDKKYLPNSNIRDGLEEGSLEMCSDWEWNNASGKYSMAIGERSQAFAEASFASGYQSRVNEEAWCGHAEGRGVTVSGLYAHAENFYTEAIGESSHAEGVSSIALGDQSHAEGWYSEARGQASHGENSSRAFGDYSHSEGSDTFAGGEASHAEGKAVILSNYMGYINGEANALNYVTNKTNNPNIVPGETVVTLYINNGHATNASAVVETYDKTTGALTLNRTLSENEAVVNGSVKFQIRGAAFGDYSHIEGYGTQALGQGAHAEGIVANDLVGSVARGDGSHIEGVGTETGLNGYGAHAEGFLSKANGWASHAEGQGTTAEGNNSHAEGYNTTAVGQGSHAEGGSTTASDDYSHAEGYGTTASHYSHAEGNGAKASGFTSHAEGFDTIAKGTYSHAEGFESSANGEASHAEGKEAVANGDYSHVEGQHTAATGEAQHVQGKYNIASTTFAHIVGNGTSVSATSNAHTLDWSGNAWFAGDVYVGSTSGKNKDAGSKKLATEEFVGTEVAALVGSAPETLDTIEELATALNNNKDIVTVLNDAIATKANKTEVYTKAEVDALLANYYTKAQVDAAITAAIDEAFANIVRAESTSF